MSVAETLLLKTHEQKAVPMWKVDDKIDRCARNIRKYRVWQK
jgi:hypothetical protein